MFSSLTDPLILGAVIGALAGWPLVNLASWRAARQPVDFDLESEAKVLRWVLLEPSRLVRLHSLQAEHFADRRHLTLWQNILDTAGTLPELPEDADEEAIHAAGLLVPTGLAAAAAAVDAELTESLMADGMVEENHAMAAAQRVFDAGSDRLAYPGASPIERCDDPSRPLVRRRRPPTLGRYAVGALLGAAAGSVTPAVAAYAWPHGAALYFAIAALAVLSIGSIIWAFVDHDTLLIDFETFFPLAALAWALTIAADFAGGSPRRALHGFALSAALAVGFRVINRVYGAWKLRSTGVRVEGMGGGDSWLVLATAGVPAALAGSVNLWYLCAMSGMLASLVVWLMRWPTPWRIDRSKPYAFGPYLALGWIIGGAAAVSGLQIM